MLSTLSITEKMYQSFKPFPIQIFARKNNKKHLHLKHIIRLNVQCSSISFSQLLRSLVMASLHIHRLQFNDMDGRLIYVSPSIQFKKKVSREHISTTHRIIHRHPSNRFTVVIFSTYPAPVIISESAELKQRDSKRETLSFGREHDGSNITEAIKTNPSLRSALLSSNLFPYQGTYRSVATFIVQAQIQDDCGVEE